MKDGEVGDTGELGVSVCCEVKGLDIGISLGESVTSGKSCVG